ncbi:MAG: ABC transporter ATP-binding protein [bacterium]
MIIVENLEFGYNSRTVLRDISFRIDIGDTVGIIGPNGGGKTTLIRLLSGLLRPQSGRVLLKVDNTIIVPGDIKKKTLARYISVLPQNPTVLEDYKVEDVVVMGRFAHSSGISYNKSDYEITKRLMREIGIEQIKDRLINQLSGGEKKMVLIARTIAQDTPILIFDEPTADLDIAHRERIMEFIAKKCKEENRTLLVAMHDITLSARYLKRLILIANREIISDGMPRDVINKANILKAYQIETDIKWYEDLPFIKPLIS